VALCRGRERRDEAPMSTQEVAERVAFLEDVAPHQRRPIKEGERSANVLRSLADKGLARRLGRSQTNAWCWEITDEGRDALRQEMVDAGLISPTDTPGWATVAPQPQETTT
jgi:hypothetical protein